jgi:hypothetical protein
VQHEFFRDSRLEVAYVGHKNLHWETVRDANGVLPGNRLDYVRLENVGGAGALRPFGALVGDSGIKYYEHTSSSNYQALQSMYNMRMGRSTLQLSYTFSKLLANSQQIDSPPFNVDAYDVHASWGPDILNHPHMFSGNFVYEFPELLGQNAFLRALAGGWQASTLVNISSGPSISVLMNGIQGLADPSGVGAGGNSAVAVERPNRVGGQSCNTGGSDPTAFINPNMFTISGFQLGHIGSSGVGICSGPPTRNVDFGLNKSFKITERVGAQFRLEFFNLFNHPLYNAQDVINNNTISFNDIVYGDASGNAVPLGPTATQILSGTPNFGANFGKSLSVRENGFRQIQYALKFTF